MNEIQTTQKPQAVAKRTIEQLITGDRFKQAVTMSLPKHCKPERFIRVALSAFNRTPKLRQCTEESLFGCFLRLSELGLEADGRRAHLIPYGTECTLIVDYKGLAELIMRSGDVSHLYADIVCDQDEFEYNMGQIIKHRVNFREERGPMYAAYAVAKLKDGNLVCQVLSKSEVDSVRKRSRAGGNGPWVTDYNEMAKKTAFRRLSKWLPLSPELRDAIEKDDDAIVAPQPMEKPVFDTPPQMLPEPETTPAPADPDDSADTAPNPSNSATSAATGSQSPPSNSPAGNSSAAAVDKRDYKAELSAMIDANGITVDEFVTFARAMGNMTESMADVVEIDGRVARGLVNKPTTWINAIKAARGETPSLPLA